MRVLFYSDVAVFGGHEVTVLDALAGAVSVPDVEVGVTYCARNEIFRDRLGALPAAARLPYVQPHPFFHEAGDMARAFSPSAKRRAITDHLRRWSPDWVVVCQGHIGVSLCALAAARRSGARVASFLPMAHTMRQMAGRGGLVVGAVDHLLARAYRWPDAFLTIGEQVAGQLCARHGIPRERIRVVAYGPDLARLQRISRSDARARLGLEDGYWMGMVGRVDFAQKGHDVAIDAMARHADILGNVRLLVVGGGPDLQRAKDLVEQCRLGDRIRFLPWRESPSLVYSAVDMLLLPSRYEGVPIVMMEAMFHGLPVAASDADGMRELLPAAWRFAPGSTAGLADTVRRLRAGVDPELLERNRDHIVQRRNSATFRAGVSEWVRGLDTGHGRRP